TAPPALHSFPTRRSSDLSFPSSHGLTSIHPASSDEPPYRRPHAIMKFSPLITLESLLGILENLPFIAIPSLLLAGGGLIAGIVILAVHLGKKPGPPRPPHDGPPYHGWSSRTSNHHGHSSTSDWDSGGSGGFGGF